MQLIVYSLAVRDIYKVGDVLKVGDWFLRSNEKKYFEPDNQTVEALKVEILDIATKIRAGKFKPKKDTWECRY
jgi:hypothetical protein